MNNPLASQIEQLQARWNQLQPRERLVLGLGGVALLLIILYAGLWQPLHQQQATAETRLQEQRLLAQDLERAAVLARNSGSRAGAPSSSNQSLITVVDQSLKASQLSKPDLRIQEDGASRVRVWLEDVSFDALAGWTATLQQRHGISISTADLDRTSGAGLVNARLTLERGA